MFGIIKKFSISCMDRGCPSFFSTVTYAMHGSVHCDSCKPTMLSGFSLTTNTVNMFKLDSWRGRELYRCLRGRLTEENDGRAWGEKGKRNILPPLLFLFLAEVYCLTYVFFCSRKKPSSVRNQKLDKQVKHLPSPLQPHVYISAIV